MICQDLMYGAISDGWEAADFTSACLKQDLSQRMNSIGLALPSGVHQGKLLVHPIHRVFFEAGTGAPFDDLVSEIESLLPCCGLVVTYGVTEQAMLSESRAV